MTVHFEMQLTRQLPRADALKLVKALEQFITNLSKTGPMPQMTVEVKEMEE